MKVKLLSASLLVLLVVTGISEARRRHRRRFASGNRLRNSRASPQYYCRDEKDGTTYPPRLNFKRESDGYTCNCTVKRTDSGGYRAKLACQAPRTPYQQQTEYETRRIAPSNCLYEGKLYELNSAWRMEINGVMMDCKCDSNGKLTCQYKSSDSYTRVEDRTGNGPAGVYGDPADRKCRSGLYSNGEEFAVADPSGFYSICRCIQHVASCRTVTTTGAECRFPFEVNGVFYSTCTYLGESTEPVCQTNSWGAREPVYAKCIATLQGLQNYFGYVFTNGGNSNGAKCQFPFVADGVQYNDCTAVGRDRKWCATTGNYDIDGRYGYCPDGVESSKIVNMVGNTVVLECPYEVNPDSSSPKLSWYALVDGVRQKIYVYDFDTQYGAPVQTAGEFAGRLNMPNARQLEIRNFRETDRKQFECEITDSTQTHYIETQTQTREPGPTNLKIVYTPTYGRTSFTWENPEQEYDYIQIEVQEVGEDTFRRTKLTNGENSFKVYALKTETRYETRIFAVTGEENSEKLIAEFILPTVAETSVTQVINGRLVEIPFARESSEGASIVLTWNPESVENAQMTGWLIVTEDVSTGEKREVTVNKNEGSTTIEGLIPGTTYKITLYALQGPNSRVQVVSRVVSTEYHSGTVEIPRQPSVTSDSDSVVKISWPAAPLATSYEILYSIGDSTRWRRLRKVKAQKEPKISVQGLREGITYNIKILPYRDDTPGDARVVSFDLASVQGEEEEVDTTPPKEPANFIISDISRDTVLLVWDHPEDSRPLKYRVTYQKYPTSEDDSPIVRVTSRNQYPAYGLTGDQQYIFTVTTITGELESETVSKVITTLNKVCRVNGQWKGHGEQFYRTSSQGYLQNCSCNKESEQPLTCTTMVCDVDGEDYLVGMSWSRLNEERTFYDLCSCSSVQGENVELGLTQVSCVYQKPYVPHYGADRISENFVQKILRCPFREENALPVVKWYKVQDNGEKNHIYTYHGRRAGGVEEAGAGDLAGRVTMPNRHELIINPVRVTDSGTFECVVTYRNSRPVEYLATIRVTPTIKKPNVYIRTKPTLTFKTPGSVNVNWEANSNVTSYIIEYQNLDNPDDIQTLKVSNPHVTLDNLAPSSTYRLTIIPVIGRTHGSSVNLIISTDTGGVAPDDTSGLPVAPGQINEDDEELVSTTPAPVVTTTTTETPDVQPPTRVSVPFKTATSILLDWTSEDRQPLQGTKYRIEWRVAGSEEGPQGVTVSSPRYTIKDLLPGTSYDVFLQAVYNGIPSDILRQTITTNTVDSIDVSVADVIPDVGDRANLYCAFNPLMPTEPNVYWSRTLFNSEDREQVAHYSPSGNVEIPAQFENKFTLGRAGRVLNVLNVSPEDSGQYTCTVVYSIGESDHTAKLIVNGPPKPVLITSPTIGPEDYSFNLTWSVPEDSPPVDQVEVYVQREGNDKSSSTTLSESNLQAFRFIQLQPGSTYVGTIVSINSLGRSEPVPFRFTTHHSGQPDQPTGATIKGIHPSEITVKFNQPTTEHFEHYRIKLNNLDRPDLPEQIFDVPRGDESFTVTGLTEDTLYNFALFIVNRGMESLPLETKFTTLKTPPPTPTGITMVESGLSYARFVITAPDSDDVLYYRANYRIHGTPKDQGNMVRTPEGSKELLVPLEAGKKYQLDVVAVGRDVESNAISFELTVPMLVPEVEEVVSTSTTTKVKWTQPKVRTRTITRYILVLLDQDGNVVQEETIYTQRGNRTYEFTFEDLQPETSYSLKVKEVSVEGESDWTTIDLKTGKTTVVTEETVGVHQPTGIRVAETSEDWIYITWEQPADDVTYYVVDYWTDDKEIHSINVERGADGTFPEGVDLEDIEAGKTYTVRIIAGNDQGSSQPTIHRIITEKKEFLATNHVVTDVRPAADSIELSWDGPIERVTNYRLTITDESGQIRKTINLNRQPDGYIPQHITLEDLEPNTIYQVVLSTIYNTGDEIPYTATIRTLPKPSDIVATETPETETERPRPRPTTERPRPETERPRPRPTTERPRPQTERPRPRPTTETPRPETERPRPRPTTERPRQPLAETTTIGRVVTTKAPRRTTTTSAPLINKEINYNIRTIPGPDFVNIFFELPEDNPSGTFVIQYKPVEGGTYKSLETPTGSNSRINIHDLLPGTKYVVWSKILSDDYTMQKWKKIFFTTSPASSEPTPTLPQQGPTSVKITSLDTGSNEVTLTWEKPEEKVDNYVIAIQPSNGSEQPKMVEVPGDLTEVTIGKLSPQTDYTFNIKSKNENGDSPWTPFQATTEEEEIIAPGNFVDEGQPSINVNDEGLVINWPEPTISDGIRYINYIADDETVPKVIRVPLRSHRGNVIKKTLITDLRPNKNYVMSVKVAGEEGSTPWTTWNIETTDDDFIIGQPTNEFETPKIINITPGENSADITWSGPTTNTDGYVITIGRPGDSPQVIKIGQPSNTNTFQSYNINGLQPDTEYTISIVPYETNDDGSVTEASPISTNFQTLTETVSKKVVPVPVAPRNVRPKTITNTTAEITWNRTPYANYYFVQFYPMGGVTQIRKVQTESVYLQNLLPNRDYTFRIKAIGSGGQSTWTKTTFRTRPSPQPVNENFESDFTQMTTHDMSVDLSFSGPRTNVQGYVVLLRGPDGVVFTRNFDGNQPDHTFRITDLQPGTTYQIELETYHVNGDHVTVERSFTTDEPLPTTTTSAVTPSPSNIEVEEEVTSTHPRKQPTTTVKPGQPDDYNYDYNYGTEAPDVDGKAPDLDETVPDVDQETPAVDEKTPQVEEETPEVNEETLEIDVEESDVDEKPKDKKEKPKPENEAPLVEVGIPRGDYDETPSVPEVDENKPKATQETPKETPKTTEKTPTTTKKEVEQPRPETVSPTPEVQEPSVEEEEKTPEIDTVVPETTTKKPKGHHKHRHTTVRTPVVKTTTPLKEDDKPQVVTDRPSVERPLPEVADKAPEVVNFEVTSEDDTIKITVPQDEKDKFEWVEIHVAPTGREEAKIVTVNRDEFDDVITLADLTPGSSFDVKVVFADENGEVTTEEEVVVTISPVVEEETPEELPTTPSETPAKPNRPLTPVIIEAKTDQDDFIITFPGNEKDKVTNVEVRVTEQESQQTFKMNIDAKQFEDTIRITDISPERDYEVEIVVTDVSGNKKTFVVPIHKTVEPTPEASIIDASEITISGDQIEIPVEYIKHIHSITLEVITGQDEDAKVFVIPGSEVTQFIDIPHRPSTDFTVRVIITDKQGRVVSNVFRFEVIDVLPTSTTPAVSSIEDIYFEVTSEDGLVTVQFPQVYVDDIDRIRVQVVEQTDSSTPETVDIVLTGSEVTNEIVIPGLSPDKDYDVRLVIDTSDLKTVRKDTVVRVVDDRTTETTPVAPGEIVAPVYDVITTDDGVVEINFPSDQSNFPVRVVIRVTPEGRGDQESTVLNFGPSEIIEGITIDDLEPDNKYEITVVTIDENGRETTQHHTVVVVEEPLPPVRPRPQVDNVIAQVDEVIIRVVNPGPEYNEITVEILDESGNVIHTSKYPIDRPIVIQGLTPDSEYQITITAINEPARIQSQPTTIVVTTKPLATLEKPIVSVNVEETTAVVDFTGSTKHVKYYVVEYFSTEDETPKYLYLNHPDFTPTYQRVYVENLTPGNTYNISVQAFNEQISSDKTTVTVFVEEQKTKPVYRVRVVSVEPDNDHVTVLWDSDVNQPGTYIIKVQETGSEQEKMVSFDATGFTGSKTTIHDLAPDTTYDVWVVIKDDQFTYESDKRQFTTLKESNIQAPGKPESFVDLITTSTTATIRWKGSSDNVDTYIVLLQELGQIWQPTMFRLRGKGGLPPFKHILIRDLKPDTRYQVAVKAAGPGGESGWLTDRLRTKVAGYDNGREPTPPPPLTAPTSVTVDEVLSDRVMFRVVDDQDLDFHEIKWKVEGTRPEFKDRFENGRPIVLQNLKPDTSYIIRITGHSNGIHSAPFTTRITTLPQAPVDDNVKVPAKAALPFRQIVHPTSADFAWRVPLDREFKQTYLEYREDRPDTDFEKIIMRPEYEAYTIRYLTPTTQYLGRLTLVPPNGGGKAVIHNFRFSTTNEEAPEVNTMPVPISPSNIEEEKTLARVETTTTTTTPAPTTTTRATTTTTTVPTTTTTSGPVVERVGLITIPRPGESQISWIPTDVVDRYFVTYGPISSESPRVMEIDGSQNKVDLIDLVPGVEYRIQIVSELDGIESVPATATFTAKMPGPKNLHVTPIAGHRVRITWDNPRPDVSSTQVDYKLSTSDHYTTKVLSSDTTKLYIPFKPEDYRLELRMTTKGRVNGRVVESLPSTYSVYLRVSNNTLGGNLVRVTDVSDRDAHVIVSSEDINGGWIVTIYDKTNEIYESPIEYPGTTTRGHLPDLKAGSSYTAVVRNSDSGEEIGRSHFMTKVSAPSNVRVSTSPSGNVVLSWRKPNNAINGYLIKYRPTNSRNWKVVEATSGKTQHEFTKLNPDTEYQVVITPTFIDVIADQYKTPGMTSSIRFTTPERPEYVLVTQAPSPAQPRPPSNIRFPTTTATTGRVTWTPSPDQIDTYSVNVLRRADNRPVFKTSVPADGNSVVLNGLRADTDYVVQISSVRGGQSSVVQRAMFHTSDQSDVDSTPVETESDESFSQKIATIKWEDSNGLNYQKYRVVAQPVNEPSLDTLTWEVDSNSRSYRLNRLQPGITYRVYVEGFVGGSWVRVVEERTITPALQAPENFRAIKSQMKTIIAAWNRPDHPITGYKLTYVLEGSSDVQTVTPAPSADSDRAIINNLIPAKRYLLKLYSVKDDQVSSPTSLFMDTILPKPKRFNAIQATPNIIGMTWVKPLDEVTHYTLRVVAPGGHEIVDSLQLSGDATSYRIENLQPDTRYRIYLTAWVGDVASQPSYKSRHTSKQVSTVTGGESQHTQSGYLISWRGKSRTVDGWKVLVEPQDGSEGYEQDLDRFTKQIELTDLKNNVEYVVKVYPFSGTLLGEPSIISIPASNTNFISNHEEHASSTSEWELHVPQVTTNSMTVRWPEPTGEGAVEGYRLQYKIAGEPDSSYRDVNPQPQLSDSSAVIENLEAGTVYTIKMTAIHGNGRETVLVINVNTPIVPPTNLGIKKTDTSYLLTWERPNTEISGYVIKYRAQSDDLDSTFKTVELGPDQNDYELISLVPGQKYEIRLVAKSGEYSSQVQSFQFQAEELNSECIDRTTNMKYQLGESWTTTVNNFRMNCTCAEPRQLRCSADNYCQDGDDFYTAGQKWQKLNEESGEVRHCECIRGVGYKCFIKNCPDGDNFYNDGDQWVSSVYGTSCVCECSDDWATPCMTKCRRRSSK